MINNVLICINGLYLYALKWGQMHKLLSNHLTEFNETFQLKHVDVKAPLLSPEPKKYKENSGDYLFSVYLVF